MKGIRQGVFDAEFVVDTSIDAPTLIHVSKQFWYPKGYTVKVTPNISSTEIEELENTLSIRVKNPNLNGQTMKIQIKPK